MSRYLLDTNTLSDLVNDENGPVAGRIAAMPVDQHNRLCTSIVVAAEMRFGALKKRSIRLMQRVEDVLEMVEVLPLASGADREYAALRVELERSGRPISANDMLIAAHALATRCVLVTDNVREFRRVPGLRVENWRRP